MSVHPDTLLLDAVDGLGPCSLVVEESGESRLTVYIDGEPKAGIGETPRVAIRDLLRQLNIDEDYREALRQQPLPPPPEEE